MLQKQPQHAASMRTLPSCPPCIIQLHPGLLKQRRPFQTASPLAAAAAARQDETVCQQQLASSSSHATPMQQPAPSTSTQQLDSWWSRLDWELLLLVSAAGPVPAALAEEGLKYDASRGEGIVKTISGAGYIGLLLYFLFRVLNRRARKAREERLAGQGPVRTVFTTLIEKVTEGKDRPQATAGAAFIGAVQAGLIGFGLFMFASKVEGIVYSQDLPSGYTARNIAITVRTIIVGLMYLATFIFSANALGLAGLSVQLLLFPDSLPDDEAPSSRLPKEPQLPKVTVTSSPAEIKAAFDAVAKSQHSKAAGSTSAAASSSSSSSSLLPAAADAAGAVAAEGSSSSAGSDSSDSKGRAMAGATSSTDSS